MMIEMVETSKIGLMMRISKGTPKILMNEIALLKETNHHNEKSPR